MKKTLACTFLGLAAALTLVSCTVVEPTPATTSTTTTTRETRAVTAPAAQTTQTTTTRAAGY